MSIPSTYAYTDGTLATAARTGLPTQAPGFPGVTRRVILNQPMQMQISAIGSWSPLPLNTAHTEDSTYILVEETEPKDMGCGQLTWNRRYARIPAAYSEWATVAQTYIGYPGITGINLTTSQQVAGRAAFSMLVPCREQNDFFLVASSLDASPLGTIAGPGTVAAPYDTPGSIPSVAMQRYYAVLSTGTIWLTDSGAVWNSPPYVNPSVPSRVEYEQWCKNSAQLGWNSDTAIFVWGVDGSGNGIVTKVFSGPNPGQIVCQDSKLERWMGNIWVRKTRFVLAK